jgi:type IV pilus assembly protein PilB
MKTKKRLGDMLIEAGFLQEDQLMQCIAEQKKVDLPLGKILIRNRYVTEEQIAATLSTQLGIPLFRFDDYNISAALVGILPAELVRQYKIIPVEDDAFSLVCAMLDPLDGPKIERVEREIGKPVDPIICTEAEFTKLYEMIYGDGLNEQLGTILEEAQEAFDTDELLDEPSAGNLANLEHLAAETPVVRTVNWILAKGIQEDASDIHISPERQSISLRMRVDGKLKEFKAPPKSMLLPLVSRIKIMGKMDISLSHVPQDGRFSMKINNREVHFRASCLPTVNGENVVLRILNMNTQQLDLSQLGFEPEDRDRVLMMTEKPQGMFLATGPTGSGKSTTLYSLLKTMNKPDVNIITTEDPVEYRMEGVRQVELNPKAGMTFASALRSILRQDPDVILVGEIRDTETANIAVRAAMTGHKVLSTLHTNSSAETIGRLIDLEVEPFMLASVLHVVVSQRLLRRLCPYCAMPFSPPTEALKRLGITPEEVLGGRFMKAVGCAKCGDSGYSGRVGIYEVLFVDDAIREVIIGGGSPLDIRDRAKACGNLQLLRDSAFRKAYEGLTTIEEAFSKVMG